LPGKSKDLTKKMIQPLNLALLLFVIISTVLFLISPVIGLADNGEFGAFLQENGLRHERERNPEDVLGYANYRFDRLQYNTENSGFSRPSHSLLLKTALLLDRVFMGNELKFDSRFAALLSLAVLGWALRWLMQVILTFNQSGKYQYFACTLGVVIFADIGYLAFMNSFYSEAIIYPFYLLAIASLLKISASEKVKKSYLLVFFFSSVMFLLAGNQYLVTGILSGMVLLATVLLRSAKKAKILAVSLGLLLFIGALTVMTLVDNRAPLEEKYHQFTRGALLYEGDPRTIPPKLGIDERYALLAETLYFNRTLVIHPADELLYRELYANYSGARVAVYYLSNPQALAKLMEIGWRNSLVVRPEVLGNYPRSAGKTFGEKSAFFSLWSLFKQRMVPGSAGFAYLLLVLSAALSIQRMIVLKNRNSGRNFYFMEGVMLYIALISLSQILTAFIGAGDTDLRHRLFLSAVSLDLLFYISLTYALSLVTKTHDI